VAFSALFQWLPGDSLGLQRFLLEHYLEHRLFTDTLLGQTPPVLTVEYPIQQMEDPNRWLTDHQRMSQSVWAGIGGGQSTDFERLDWNDKVAVQDWQLLHAAWHQSVRDSLNL